MIAGSEKKSPPPTERRTRKWKDELRPWERDQAARNPAHMHRAERLFNARRRGALRPCSPRLLEQVRVQFRFRFTFVLLELVILAVYERKLTHLHVSYAELALLLGCAYSTARKVVAEAVEEGFLVVDSMFGPPPFEGWRGRGGEGDRALDHQQLMNAYRPGPKLELVWANEVAWRRYYAGEGPPPPHHTRPECPRCGRAPWGHSKLCYDCHQQGSRDDLRPAPAVTSVADPSTSLLQKGRRRRLADRLDDLGVRRAETQATSPTANHSHPAQAELPLGGDAQNQARPDPPGVGTSVLTRDEIQSALTAALGDPSTQNLASPGAPSELNGAVVLNGTAVPAPKAVPLPAPPAGQPEDAAVALSIVDLAEEQDAGGALDQDAVVHDVAGEHPALEGTGGGAGPPPGPRPFCRPGRAGLPPWYMPEFRAALARPQELRDVIARGELWCRLIEQDKTPEEAEEAVRELRAAQMRRRCTPRSGGPRDG